MHAAWYMDPVHFNDSLGGNNVIRMNPSDGDSVHLERTSDQQETGEFVTSDNDGPLALVAASENNDDGAVFLQGLPQLPPSYCLARLVPVASSLTHLRGESFRSLAHIVSSNGGSVASVLPDSMRYLYSEGSGESTAFNVAYAWSFRRPFRGTFLGILGGSGPFSTPGFALPSFGLPLLLLGWVSLW